MAVPTGLSPGATVQALAQGEDESYANYIARLGLSGIDPLSYSDRSPFELGSTGNVTGLAEGPFPVSGGSQYTPENKFGLSKVFHYSEDLPGLLSAGSFRPDGPVWVSQNPQVGNELNVTLKGEYPTGSGHLIGQVGTRSLGQGYETTNVGKMALGAGAGQALLSPYNADRAFFDNPTLRAINPPEAISKAKFGPFDSGVSANQMDIMLSEDPAIREAKAKIYGSGSPSVNASKVALSKIAKLAGPLQIPLALSAMNTHLVNKNIPALAGAALSMAPGPLGWGGAALEGVATTDFIRDAGEVDENPELMQAIQSALISAEQPELGVDERDYRSQVFEALSGMKTGMQELDILGTVGSALPGIKAGLKNWARGITSSGSDQATPMFQQGTESLLPTNYDASSVSDEEMDLVYPEAIKYSFSDDEDLRDKILSDKWSQAITRFTPFTKNTSAFDDKVMRDLKIPDRTTGQERSINKKEYDALIHLAGTSRQGSDIAVRLYEEVFPDTDPWEAMKDAINNEVGRSYQGTDASLKEMLLDPRTVTDVSDIRGVGRSMLSGTPGVGADPVTSQEVRDTEAQEKSDERNRQAAVKSAEKEASAERAAKERAERAKEAARTERDRARAEQDRLAALSRQRAAEEKARKAAQSAAQKAEADRKKRAQQSASAAALASARMESLRQVELMRKRQEEKLLQDKLADQMARYQTTGRWVGGL